MEKKGHTELFGSRPRYRGKTLHTAFVFALLASTSLLPSCASKGPLLSKDFAERRFSPSGNVKVDKDLPSGYYRFNKSDYFNLQLNRWYSWGYARLEDIRAAGAAIRGAEDCKGAFLAQAEKAAAEGRLKNAAFYYRAAEFLVESADPDKLPLYRQFIDTFYEAFKADGIERRKVPYGEGYLPVMRLAPEGTKKGTVVLHGGFDSFIEEFYCFARSFALNGYEVYAFDGPGQGGALRLYGVLSDHAWEKPVGAVLDAFGLSDATLVGISMGGYWCLRAAAHEKRVLRVIAFPPLYDWMESQGEASKAVVRAMLKNEKLMRWSIEKKKADPKMRQVIDNTLLITGKTDVLDVVEWELGMNKEFLRSELVDQDVLLLAGEDDAFQPLVLYRKQMKALLNAKSLEGRVIRREEGGSAHCAIGNPGLAIQIMVEWLDGKGAETALP